MAWKWIVGPAAAFLTMLLACSAAMAAGNAPDEVLAQKPIIAVARWPRASAERHDLIENKAVLQAEVRTELLVERVIKGDISPGRYKLLSGWGADWQEDENLPDSHTLSPRLGEVDDVTQPNLWFLSRKRSWDKTDPTAYLSLDAYRGVQPLELEPYFAALQSPDRDRRMGELRCSESSAVAMRARDYQDGRPWYWEQMHALIDPGLYSMISCRYGMTRLRQSLNDKDPAVRAVAVGLLVQRRDEKSIPSICRAVAGIPRSWLNCDLVKSLAAWGDRRLVPALIACLQTDRYEGWGGEGVRITALKAQAALERITGYVFPFDVRSSQQAWADAQQYPDAAAQLKSLADRLGNDPNPLQATAVTDRGHLDIEVKNRSRQPIVLARCPAEIEFDRGRGDGIGRSEPVAGEPSFTLLKPGQSLRCLVQVPSEILATDPATRQISLLYPHNGNESGVNAWIGLLKLTLGSRRADLGQMAAGRSQDGPAGARGLWPTAR